MNEKEANKSSKNQNATFASAPYFVTNLCFKTAVISLSVSTVTQPFKALLNHVQTNSLNGLNGGIFRSLWRGFLPYAVAGQQRGAVAVTSKQANREVVEEEFEFSYRQNWFGTLTFSQADLLFANALIEKAKLENAGIINKSNFKWSLVNYKQLTFANWGSRSLSSFMNFSALGAVGDYLTSRYHFKNDGYNKIAGGATAGVIATLFTSLPNSYADRKLLASKIENGRLLTITPYTFFRQVKSHVGTVGVKQAFTQFVFCNYLKEVAVRSPMSALTFATIFYLDNIMGVYPLEQIGYRRKEVSMEQFPQIASKKL